MTYTGHVVNGQLVFDGPPPPEGSAVRIEVVGATDRSDAELPTLLERLKSVVGKATGLPEDASVNIDHYLYGHPKR